MASRPHIILALADDLGWNNVGWRNAELRTPALDELRATGVDLQRLYVFKYCSPSRSSLMSGRLPLHVTQNNKNNEVTNPGGVDLRMTLLPARLKEAGYYTAMVGKSHLGARSVANLPINRGFDSHFGFLKGGEDHLTQRSQDDGLSFVDLWRDHGPAFGENGTFSTYIYTREAVRVIEAHAALNRRERATAASTAAVTPLFMYLSWHAVHTPLEAPPDRTVAPVADGDKTRASMNALVEMLDEGMANVTAALRSSGLWQRTLLAFHADNGGWTSSLELGGNNWPLRGGKVSAFEGGVRATGFVNGGFLDAVNPALRGSAFHGLMHICDWYATCCGLAGIPVGRGGQDDDDDDDEAGVPPSDSIDVWPALSTPNATTSPRTEVPLEFCTPATECDEGPPGSYHDAALIVQQDDGRLLKLINGTQGYLGWYQGPRFPNASSTIPPHARVGTCVGGCLFDVRADPGEHVDLRHADPAAFERLARRLAVIGRGVYQTNYTGGYDSCLTAKDAYARDRGFLAPRCVRASAAEPTQPQPSMRIRMPLASVES